MELGTKLKNARIEINITQEKVAEEIGISRQTLSNWENEKTYPDIVSLIKLSDLYSISLDTLLKENGKPTSYVDYIDKAINSIKNKRKMYKCIEIGVYLFEIILYIVLYWITAQDNVTYEIEVICNAIRTIIIPCTLIIVSLFIGIDKSWGNKKWLLVLFFGTISMLSDLLTVTLDVFGDDLWEVFSITFLDPMGFVRGVAISALCIWIGSLAQKFHINNQQKS